MSNSEDPRYIVATPVTTQADGQPHCPPWCQLSPHTVLPHQVAVGHYRETGAFAHEGMAVTVYGYQSQTLSGTASDRPIVALTRLDDGHDREQAITVDLVPHEAAQLATVLGGLNPIELLRFASALAKAAALFGHRLDDGEAV